MPISDEEFRLLTIVNNAHKAGWPLPADVAMEVEPLVAKGLVVEDGALRCVPDEVLWQLLGEQRPLK